MKFITGFIIVFIICFILLGLQFNYNKREKAFENVKWSFRKKQLFSLFTLIILVGGMFIKINANEVGIIYDPLRGGIQAESYSEGFHYKSIFQEITKISSTNRTANVIVMGQTQDSIYAEFEITIVYKIDVKNAGSFYKVTGNTDIKQEQLVSNAKEALQSVTTKYDIYAILGSKLENVRAQFNEILSTMMLERYYLTIVSTSFDDVDAGSRIEAIIQNKAEAMQQVEIVQLEKEKAEIEVSTSIMQAEGQAQVALIKAEAESEAQVILNSVTVNAITNMYIGQFTEGQDLSTPAIYGYLTIQEVSQIILKQLYYDTWDGKLPEVISDGSGIIINP